MACRASDLAKYVLKFFSDLDSPISNLQLQKLLYFCWIDYYNKLGESLFPDTFVAWTLGPAIVSVYHEYCSYGGRPIFKRKGSFPDGPNKDVIDNCLKGYQGWSAFRLVDESHHKGGAWDNVYKDGQGKGAVISFDLIKKLECGRQR